MPARHQEFACCSCSSRHSHGCISPPQTYQSDHILQSLAHRLLLLVPQPPPLPLFPSNLETKHASSPPFTKSSRNLEFDLSAILRRLEALEASLSTFHSSSSPSSLLRNAAARVIQVYFRAFLVRRSRTLGQLQRLAHIKSVLETLKFKASDSSCADLDNVSVAARRLLLQLDSVQGRDIIVVNGKRSVGLELLRFIELLDALYMDKCKLSTKPMNFLKGSRVLADKIGGKKKKIDIFSRFGNGNVDLNRETGYKLKPLSAIGNGKEDGYLAKAARILTSTDSEDFSMPLCPTSGSFSSDDEELLGMADREHESQSYRNCNKSSKNDLRSGNRCIDNELQNCGGDFIFSAPLPMKMESRAGSDDM